jgi:hypothetical protein
MGRGVKGTKQEEQSSVLFSIQFTGAAREVDTSASKTPRSVPRTTIS